MTNKQKLEIYLQPFLLDDINNGKTIMLSGAWGAGKTYFWQNEIEPKLSNELKDKACVYVSLYGKESISEIKSAIYQEAYKSIFGEDIISKSALLIENFATILGKSKNIEAVKKINQKSKDNKSEELLKDGSVICLDDFERKSKKIDLNDLFGLISHLALSLKCKLVIILNSDVFTGKEAEVFKNVKEKTVNKFLYFEPTIEELFQSISQDEKYNKLEEYKEAILKAIKETEELNARIYIQVLDNCLEWLKVKKNLDERIVRVLVLGTFNFVLNHMVLDYQLIVKTHNNDKHSIKYTILSNYPSFITNDILSIKSSSKEEYISRCKRESITFMLKRVENEITVNAIDFQKQKFKETFRYSDVLQTEYFQWLKNNKPKLKALWKYGYRLYYVGDVEEETYNEIAQFIKSGILI